MEIQSNKNLTKKYPYEILTTEQVTELMTDFIKDVNSVIQIPASLTRLLLSHFNWDKQRLLEKYYDGNQEKLFSEAHIFNPFEKPHLHTSEPTETCEVCLTTQPTSKMDSLACGHRFCLECWNDYLISKIMKHSIGEAISCPARTCKIYVDDDSVAKLCTDNITKRKYQRLVAKSFADCNKLLKWCPTKNCNHAIKVQSIEAKPVTCVCKITFCFACGDDGHVPVSCDLLRKWNVHYKRFYEDSKSADWIESSTKDCPRCNVTIQKDGGCNVMYCINCRHSFCWFCSGSFRNGDDHYDECVRYIPRQNAYHARRAIGRDEFYYQKFMNHQHSLKIESELYEKIKQKINQDVSWTDLLKKAVETLCSCRRILAYTYTFACCLEKNNQSEIFEDNQRDLEGAVEVLSGYLERDINGQNEDGFREVQDKFRYCEGRKNVLLEHIREGYEKNWWKFVV